MVDIATRVWNHKWKIDPIVRSLIDPEGGMKDVRALDNVSFADWFKSHGGSQASIDRMWDPIGAPVGLVLECYALG